ncbi:zinc metalloprotease [Bacteroidia bacterium]|nr:zinc metalloprotease [Bacteroidia bacterium]
MTVTVQILQLLLSLSLLVLIHEFGHFLFAKIFHTRVDKFYLFFNPWFSLFKKKIGDTVYGIGWLPVGGYVKIAGMVDESMDLEQMKKEPEPWEFRSKPIWQRLLIMLGGVLMNVVLAFVIYICTLYAYGESYLPSENLKYGVTCDAIFKEMGLQNGDIIVSLDDRKVDNFFKVIADILLKDSKTMQVRRGDSLISLEIPLATKVALTNATSAQGERAFIEPRRLLDSMFVGGFADYSAAYDAGVRKGDRILTVNGSSFHFYDEFTTMLDTLANKDVKAVVERKQVETLGQSSLQSSHKTTRDTLLFQFRLGADAKFGILFGSTERWDLVARDYSFTQAIPAGIEKGATALSDYVKQFRLIFSPDYKAYKSVGGLISMVNVFPGLWDWHSFWALTALISIMLAVVNILPIPALDGGHIILLLYELVTRRKPSVKFMANVQTIGMFIIIALFMFTCNNDIARFF